MSKTRGYLFADRVYDVVRSPMDDLGTCHYDASCDDRQDPFCVWHTTRPDAFVARILSQHPTQGAG